MTSTIDTELEAFIEQCIDALSHQVQGDSQPLLAMWSRADVAADPSPRQPGDGG